VLVTDVHCCAVGDVADWGHVVCGCYQVEVCKWVIPRGDAVCCVRVAIEKTHFWHREVVSAEGFVAVKLSHPSIALTWSLCCPELPVNRTEEIVVRLSKASLLPNNCIPSYCRYYLVSFVGSYGLRDTGCTSSDEDRCEVTLLGSLCQGSWDACSMFSLLY
jgi:hypothetical protein